MASARWYVPAVLHIPSRRLVAALAIVVLAVAGVACSNGEGEPEAGPTTSASPTPTPRATTAPVRGDRRVETFAVSNEQAVWDRSQPDADPAAIEQAAVRVGDWFDAHLTALQDGSEGRLQEVAAPGLLDGAPPEVVAAVTTALAGPDQPVGSATYEILVAHTDAPQWVRATVTVTGEEGATRTAQFVFEIAEDAIVLIAAGPGAGQA